MIIFMMSTSAGQIIGLHASISALFRSTRQKIHGIGQADMHASYFTRLVNKLAGTQTG